MKVLFVCNMGMHRSRTAAELWHNINADETDYMGIYNEKHDHKNKLSKADLIIVMEPEQRKWISENYPDIYLKKKILCLDIKDIYRYNQPELVELLWKKFKEIEK